MPTGSVSITTFFLAMSDSLSLVQNPQKGLDLYGPKLAYAFFPTLPVLSARILAEDF